MISEQLPDARNLGEVRRWFLPLSERPGDPSDGEFLIVVGRFIGYSSSQTSNHWDHPRGTFVRAGERCNACRWFELRIFRELPLESNNTDGVDDDDDDYADDYADGGELTAEELTDVYHKADAAGQLGNYVVYKAGMSAIPGEVPFCRYDEIASPHQVVEALTTRRMTPDGGQHAFITRPSAFALAAAANFDEALETAYVNRAVS